MAAPERVTGIVLSATPIGEYDKRAVILTKERGKMSAFMRGVRRPNHPLVAAANPFVFGEFVIYEGRSASVVEKAEIKNYFRTLAEDLKKAYYGFYYTEVASYYAQEYLDETERLKLLYQTLRATESEKFSPTLIKAIYEMKTLVINGEYPSEAPLSDAALYAMRFIIKTPPEKLFTFTLSDEVEREFNNWLQAYREKNERHIFRSEEFLDLV